MWTCKLKTLSFTKITGVWTHALITCVQNGRKGSRHFDDLWPLACRRQSPSDTKQNDLVNQTKLAERRSALTADRWHVTSYYTGCPKIQPNKFPGYFYRRFPGDILTNSITPDVTLALFTRWTLPNFSWQFIWHESACHGFSVVWQMPRPQSVELAR